MKPSVKLGGNQTANKHYEAAKIFFLRFSHYQSNRLDLDYLKRNGSVFVSGQPSSIWVSRAQAASRARPSTSEFDISVSSSTSFASSSHQRIPSIELGFYFSLTGYRLSSISIYRARVRIELESDAIELGELADFSWRGGWKNH